MILRDKVKLLSFKFVIFLLANIFCAVAFASQPWGMEGFAVVEGVTNFSGGQKPGSVFNGVYHPIIRYSFNNQTYKPTLRVGLLAITYTQNQFEYTYASQSVSNMSAQREVRLGELNVDFKPTSWSELKIGIMDLRDSLNVYDIPKVLINSGFGTNRVMAHTTNVATYPYPGFGAIADLKLHLFDLGLAIFQGDPQHQSTVFKQGFFTLQELKYQTNLAVKNQPKIIAKFGFWQNYQPDPDVGYSNIGTYLMGQAYWYVNATLFNIFGELGYGPAHSNNLPYSACIGANTTGIFESRPKDKIAVGASQIWLLNVKNEIVYEATYALFVLHDSYLKIDLQYIVNPSGIKPNALAGIVRLTYNIDGHLLDRH